VLVDGAYTLRAHFATTSAVLYVDDDAPEDPGPADPNVSDPKEDGSASHPFDSIQEAIEVAGKTTKIMVHKGVYQERIELDEDIQIQIYAADDSEK
jgi:pectin methylesterase-like acyl-CoA thioesterase